MIKEFPVHNRKPMHMNWTEILNTLHSLFLNTNTRCCNRRWCHKSANAAYLSGAFMKDCICQVRLRLKAFFQLIFGLVARADKLGLYFYDTSCGSETAERPVEGASYTESAWRNSIHLIIPSRSKIRCPLREVCSKIA